MIASCDYSLLKHSSNLSTSLAHKRLFTHPHSLPSLTVPSYLIFFRLALIFLIIPLFLSPHFYSLRSLKMSSLLYTIVSCVLPTSRCRWGCSNTCVYSCMSNNPTPTAFFFLSPWYACCNSWTVKFPLKALALLNAVFDYKCIFTSF